MARLSKPIKAIILQRALDKAGITKESESLKDREELLAYRCATEFYGKEAIANALAVTEQVRALPKGLRPCTVNQKEYYIQPNIGGMRIRLELRDKLVPRVNGDGFVKMTNRDLMPCSDYELNFEANHPFAKEVMKWVSDSDTFDEKEKDLTVDIQAVLNSCNTTERLIKVWPECEELLAGIEGLIVKASLPAVQIDQLNKAIGLPSEEKK